MLLLQTHPRIIQELLEDAQGETTAAMELSPRSTIISGPRERIQAIQIAADKHRIPARRIRVTNAGHTPAMDEFQDELIQGLREIQPGPARVPFYSTTDARVLTGPELDASYWWRNLRNPVAFLGMTKRLLDEDFDLFLEVSPHPVVVPSLLESFASLEASTAVAVGSLRRNESARTSLLATAGRMYTAGYSLNWERLHGNPPARRLQLPTYPWQRKRFWLTGGMSGDFTRRGDSPLGPVFEPVQLPGLKARMIQLDLERHDYLKDHRVLGTPVLPAAMYLDLAAAAFAEYCSTRSKNVKIFGLNPSLGLPSKKKSKEKESEGLANFSKVNEVLVAHASKVKLMEGFAGI